jgi:predicted N-acetyltransferase YhbS
VHARPLSACPSGPLARCWNRTYPPAFALEPDAVAWRTAGSPWTDDDGSGALYGEAGEAAAWVVLKRPAPPGPGRWSVGALAGDLRASRHLLERALRHAAGQGAAEVAFGGDRDHFWPGVPAGCRWLAAMLERTGFELGGEVYDLARDLAGYAPPARAPESLARAGARVRRAGAGDGEALRAFLASEFPGRWEEDALRKAVADREPDDVFLLEARGSVAGFAVTQTPASARPHAGATFPAALGARWAALGPIGVAAGLRGAGLGDALLGEALLGLRSRGARTCVVDWTVLEAFYGRHGFRRFRTYVSAVARLGRPSAVS